MKRSGESTHLCQNPTVNCCDLTTQTRTQTLSKNTVTSRPVTGGCQHRTSATVPKAFQGTQLIALIDIDKTCLDIFGILQRFIENLQEWKRGLYCYGRDENRTGYHPTLFQLFRGIFFQGTWHTLFQGGWGEIYLSSWCIRSCLPFFVWGWWPQFASFGALPEHKSTWQIARVNQRTWFKVLSISGWVSSQPAAFSVLTARETSAAAMVFASPKCTLCVRWCKWLGSKDLWNTLFIFQGCPSHCWARQHFNLWCI